MSGLRGAMSQTANVSETSQTANISEVRSDGEKMQAAIAELENYRDEMAAKIAEMQEALDEAINECEQAQGDAADLEEAIAEMRPKVIDDVRLQELARIRMALKSGRHDEGRERLERVLDELDNSWRLLC